MLFAIKKVGYAGPVASGKRRGPPKRAGGYPSWRTQSLMCSKAPKFCIAVHHFSDIHAYRAFLPQQQPFKLMFRPSAPVYPTFDVGLPHVFIWDNQIDKAPQYPPCWTLQVGWLVRHDEREHDSIFCSLTQAFYFSTLDIILLVFPTTFATLLISLKTRIC
ncbi:hypothetical protein HG535_0F06250 [Zygotorulaspora mrakii]|uniref:Uncharacterized protein n=1 Tax=Zygotorulaspora mrakii TaxID=42260 RepID=A0A7H9B6I6_ZYGMR|nr:uncharacterized protein HG535_0F06250 [Zygotorulaspora mrakii]QLG74113.1 hypothetical protein HG535_0F06250 [Zygotorulaspora mrakii]